MAGGWRVSTHHGFTYVMSLISHYDHIFFVAKQGGVSFVDDSEVSAPTVVVACELRS